MEILNLELCLLDLVEETLVLYCIVFDKIAKVIFLTLNAMCGMFQIINTARYLLKYRYLRNDMCDM